MSLLVTPRCRRSRQVIYGQKIHTSCSMNRLRSIAREVWGERVYRENGEFFVRTAAVAEKLMDKAAAAGFTC